MLVKDDTKKIIDENHNILVLPAIISANNIEADKRTPEYQTYNYLNLLLADKTHLFWDSLPSGYNMEMIKDAIVDSFPFKQTDKPLRELRKTGSKIIKLTLKE